MRKKTGIILGCIISFVLAMSIVMFIMLKPVYHLEKKIANLDLNNIDESSFKELTLMKQDYNHLSEIQRNFVRNYDTLEQAQAKYQKIIDDTSKKIKNWAKVDYLPMADNIKINSQKIINKDEEYYYIVNLTNTDNKAKLDFKLGITTYDSTWTISNTVYSEKVDFTFGQTRMFEFKLDPEKIDAVKISCYEELIDNKSVLYDFGEQEIFQIK